MSDIKNYIKQAFMIPLSRTQSATHFKPCVVNGKTGFQPCSVTDPMAEKKELGSMQPDQIFPPPVTYLDMVTALKKAKKSVSEADLEKQREFTRDFGMEG